MYDFPIWIHLQFLTESSVHDLYKAHYSSKYKCIWISVCINWAVSYQHQVFVISNKPAFPGLMVSFDTTTIDLFGAFLSCSRSFCFGMIQCWNMLRSRAVAYLFITWTIWLLKYRRRGESVICIQKAPVSKRSKKPKLCSFCEKR